MSEDGKRLIQCELLLRMDCATLVEESFHTLGVSTAEKQKLGDEAERLGLRDRTKRVDLYHRLLGPPETEIYNPRAKYRPLRVLTYSLPLWPTHRVFLCAWDEHTDGCFMFLRGKRASDVPPALDALFPWKMTEDQLTTWRGAQMTEQWYPLSEYEAEVQCDDRSRKCTLVFGMGLLQRVVVR